MTRYNKELKLKIIEQYFAGKSATTLSKENKIKEKIRNLLDNSNIKNYLKNIVWEDNKLLKATSHDYKQFVELHKLQSDTITWVNQNLPDIDKAYQQAIRLKKYKG